MSTLSATHSDLDHPLKLWQEGRLGRDPRRLWTSCGVCHSIFFGDTHQEANERLDKHPCAGPKRPRKGDEDDGDEEPGP